MGRGFRVFDSLFIDRKYNKFWFSQAGSISSFFIPLMLGFNLVVPNLEFPLSVISPAKHKAKIHRWVSSAGTSAPLDLTKRKDLKQEKDQEEHTPFSGGNKRNKEDYAFNRNTQAGTGVNTLTRSKIYGRATKAWDPLLDRI